MRIPAKINFLYNKLFSLPPHSIRTRHSALLQASWSRRCLWGWSSWCGSSCYRGSSCKSPRTSSSWILPAPGGDCWGTRGGTARRPPALWSGTASWSTAQQPKFQQVLFYVLFRFNKIILLSYCLVSGKITLMFEKIIFSLNGEEIIEIGFFMSSAVSILNFLNPNIFQNNSRKMIFISKLNCQAQV